MITRHRFRMALATVASITAWALSSTPVSATVISGNVDFRAENLPGANYSAGITQTAQGDPTALWFNFTGTTLQVIGGTADEGSNWYLAQPGAALTSQTLLSGQFSPVFSLSSPSSPVPVPQGDFYLAITTWSHLDPGYTAYGWVKLSNTGTALVQRDSAVAYREQGIIIGTTTPAPEPASLFLLGFGPLSLLARRSPKRA